MKRSFGCLSMLVGGGFGVFFAVLIFSVLIDSRRIHRNSSRENFPTTLEPTISYIYLDADVSNYPSGIVTFRTTTNPPIKEVNEE